MHRNGLISRVCECGEKETETIEAKGHKDGEWVTVLEPTCVNDGKKQQICSVCSAVLREEAIEASHKFSEATCMSPMVCENCGLIQGSKLGHTTSYGKCSRCGEKIYYSWCYDEVDHLSDIFQQTYGYYDDNLKYVNEKSSSFLPNANYVIGAMESSIREAQSIIDKKVI